MRRFRKRVCLCLPNSFTKGSMLLTGLLFYPFLAAFLSMPCIAASFYSNHEQGWLWYKRDQETQKLAIKKQPVESNTVLKTKPLSAGEKIKQIQQAFEEATARAILYPTLSNVQEVMHLQKAILDRSTLFQERWMQASLFEGSYTRAEDNGAPLHRKIMQKEKEKQRDRKIRHLAKETGLFFLFQEKCPYCHAFAPVVKEFAQNYSFEVKAVSKDGEKINEFPEALSDNGIISKLNPQGIYPALFLAHPVSHTVIPLAWGMTTPAQLLDNVETVLKALERKDL